MSGLTRAVAGALALALSTAVGLLLVEGLLHVLRPPVNYAYMPQTIVVSHFTTSDFLPFALRPNHRAPFRMHEFETTVRTNSLGLRGAEIDRSRERILCLGDSFTFGFGVEEEDAFCAQLEARFGGAYQFVNAGFASGSSPDTAAVWLARHRDALAPRAVLLSVFQNDVDDVDRHLWLDEQGQPVRDRIPARIVEPGTLVTPDGARMRDTRLARFPPWVRDLLKRSYVVALVRDRVLRDASEGGTSAPADGEAVASPLSSPADPEGEHDRRDARFLLALEWVRDSAGDVPLIIHLIPDRGQAADSRMDTLVRTFARHHDIPLVERYEAFSPDDYFALDGHWTRDGHARAAVYLHEALTALGF